MSKQLSFDFDIDDYQGPDDLWLLYLWEKAMAKDDEEFENRFKLKPIEKDKSQHQNRYVRREVYEKWKQITKDQKKGFISADSFNNKKQKKTT